MKIIVSNLKKMVILGEEMAFERFYRWYFGEQHQILIVRQTTLPSMPDYINGAISLISLVLNFLDVSDCMAGSSLGSCTTPTR